MTNRECYFSSSGCRNWRWRRGYALLGKTLLPPDAAWTLLSLPPDTRATGTCSHAHCISHRCWGLRLRSPCLHDKCFWPTEPYPCPHCHCQQGVSLQLSYPWSALCTRAPRLFFQGSHVKQALGPPSRIGWINMTGPKQWCAKEAGRGGRRKINHVRMERNLWHTAKWKRKTAGGHKPCMCVHIKNVEQKNPHQYANSG